MSDPYRVTAYGGYAQGRAAMEQIYPGGKMGNSVIWSSCIVSNQPAKGVVPLIRASNDAAALRFVGSYSEATFPCKIVLSRRNQPCSSGHGSLTPVFSITRALKDTKGKLEGCKCAADSDSKELRKGGPFSPSVVRFPSRT